MLIFQRQYCLYVGGVVAYVSLSPSVTPYTSLFCLSTLVYLQYLHVHVQYRSTRSKSVLTTFSLLNTLIRVVLSIPHHLSSYHNIIISSDPATLYALSLCSSPGLLRCRAPPLAMLLLASSPWAPVWLTGLGVKPCIPYSQCFIINVCLVVGL